MSKHGVTEIDSKFKTLLLLCVLVAQANMAESMIMRASKGKMVHFVSDREKNDLTPANVSYDHRAILIGGKRQLLMAAVIHYQRSTPKMWPDLLAKAKAGGANAIQTIMFWNVHEPVRGQFNFEGRFDLVRFLRAAASAGLYVNLRIGPYACGEWNYGGFPYWLKEIPGMVFRTDNEPFKREMKRWMEIVVKRVTDAQLLAWQGGPVILTQVENEYGDVEAGFGTSGKVYMQWAADMAQSLGTRCPWIMCKQTDAPLNIIDTCNGFYCDGYRPNDWSKPQLWTEIWTGWFTAWGGPLVHRPAEDLAFAVARFVAKGGTYFAYYMYHGGTNFERTAGGPFYVTSYDYAAPIDEFGVPAEPTYSHLAALHAVLAECSDALLAVDEVLREQLGLQQELHLYTTLIDGPRKPAAGKEEEEEKCAAFLSNIGTVGANVTFRGRVFYLPAWSVTILPDCRQAAFNTAQINAQATVMGMHAPAGASWQQQQQSPHHSQDKLGPSAVGGGGDSPSNPDQVLAGGGLPSNSRQVSASGSSSSGRTAALQWSWREEPLGVWGDAIESPLPLEQISATRDRTDYLWYTTQLELPENVSAPNATLSIEKQGHAVHAFVNGHLAGSAHYGVSPFEGAPAFNASLTAGVNHIALLSMTVGLWNYGAYYEALEAGVRGQVGLKGEHEHWYAPLDKDDPDAWPRLCHWPAVDLASFATPSGDAPVALDLAGLGKGFAWVNGVGIGRIWPSILAASTSSSSSRACDQSCNYVGSYSATKCIHGCGKPTQRWYHVPREWLSPPPQVNWLVVFQEAGGDPSNVSAVVRAPHTVCRQVAAGAAHAVATEPATVLTSSLARSALERALGGARAPRPEGAARVPGRWLLRDAQEEHHQQHNQQHQRQQQGVRDSGKVAGAGERAAAGAAGAGAAEEAKGGKEERVGDIAARESDVSDAGEGLFRLQCGDGQRISAIRFASYGNPSGECGLLQRGSCHAENSLEVVEKASLHCAPLSPPFFLPASRWTAALPLLTMQCPPSNYWLSCPRLWNPGLGGRRPC
eukprot:jgi/Mesen1/9754/ME000007S09814